ncbi:hypothetical protein IEN85_22680 [Pelagicoccus sp. NFK12]|uniref:Type II secretion system protein GspG C-terminal domain-containing protein n=1 Tax=Pelagicoccus enzymogenes TaxID=2773457 RepID=A0A927IK00_9BACT|nr:hypothetical protein [Pelagicoccus enzymogenes]MBD5782323.1 hypothetical protein [Pelagicoccus enzymogenes]
MKFGLAIGSAALTMGLLLVFYGDAESPKRVSLDRLDRIEKAITAFIETNDRVPTSLQALGLPQEDLQDHIGEPFKYIVTADSVTVMSYGSDKEPGGSFFKKDFSVTIDLR